MIGFAGIYGNFVIALRKIKKTSLLLIPACALIFPFITVSSAYGSPSITEYNVPDPNGWVLSDITTGSDGNLWFEDLFDNQIGRMTPDGSVTMFQVPDQADFGLTNDLVTGPDGNVWFNLAERTSTATGEIGKITPDGTITLYPLDSNYNTGTALTTGPDGALWFTETEITSTPIYPSYEPAIGRITTSGQITNYPISDGAESHDFTSITTGPDGALWLTDAWNSTIDRMTTTGSLTEFPINITGSQPITITTGPDGALWFTDSLVGAANGFIGRLTTSGQLSEYDIPTQGANPVGITTGPDGALWFTELGGNKIGRISTDGSISEYATPTQNSNPYGITTGPDGALWFTEPGPKDSPVNNIGRLSLLSSAPTPPTNLTAPTPTNQSPALSWSSVSGATSYNVYRNDTQVASNVTTTSYTDTTAPEGTNTYDVTAVNSSGESSPSNSVSVLVDRTAPAITYTLSPSPNSASWNNSPVTVTFNCSDNTGGSGIASCSSPMTEATDGTYTLTGYATDNAGNTASVNVTVNVDQTPPTVSAPSLSSGTITAGNSTTLTASTTDALSGVTAGEYYIGNDPGQGNGTAMTYNANTGTLTASLGSSLNPGTYTINVRAEDAAGNWSSPQSVTLTVNAANQTIGYNQQGDHKDTGDANNMNGTKFTVGSVGGSAVSMSAYVGDVDSAPNNQYQLSIYTVKSNGKPGTLVAQTNTGTLTANSWNTLPITANLSPNTQYWLMYNTNSTKSGLNELYYVNAEQGIGAYGAQTFGIWPNTFPSPTLTNTEFSLTLTYTPNGQVPPNPTPLVGDNNIESNPDSDSSGTAEAFQYTATSSGNSQNLSVYLGATSAASAVTVGIYTDNNNAPGTLLGQGTITSPVDGTWNNVSLPSALNITSGTKYWIAILSPKGDGNIGFRDKASGSGPGSISSSKANLTTLPDTWASGSQWTSESMSGYAY